MEAGEVAPYVLSFLGVGVLMKVLDYWLAGRRERRAGLRDKDRERIDAVRAMAESYVERARQEISVGAKLDLDGHPDWPAFLRANGERAALVLVSRPC